MESLDILILRVEASIALAGFEGIIATFQRLILRGISQHSQF